MIVECSVCGKSFNKSARHVKLYEKRGYKYYCSKDCHVTKIKCNCANCGKEIYKQPYQIKKVKQVTSFVINHVQLLLIILILELVLITQIG